MAQSPERTAWRAMLYRCENATCKAYHYYGGRGITVCERWHRFEQFFEDMGERPSRHHSLDRIDPDGNYEPQNCRWASWTEQAANKSTWVKPVTAFGQTMLIREWAVKLHIKSGTIRMRLFRGWTPERALDPRAISDQARLITVGEETLQLYKWADRNGIRPDTIARRLDYGWTAERAVSQAPRKSLNNNGPDTVNV